MSAHASPRPITTILASLLAFVIAVAGISVAPTAAHAAPESATAGSLDWGFKESWRSYLASGGVAPVPSAGATYTDASNPAASRYTWTPGTATFDPAARSGSAQFTGAVQFLHPGHGIDVTLSNPRVTFSGGTGQLYYNLGAGEVLGAEIDSVSVSAPTISGTTATVEVSASNLKFTDNNSAITYSSATTPGPDGFSFTLSYTVESQAEPTTVTLSLPGGPQVITGGSVVLSALVPNDIPGTVAFYDGATPIGTATPVATTVTTGVGSSTTTKATLVHANVAAGTRTYTATFTPTDSAAWAPSTSGAAVVTAASADLGAVAGNVSDATLEWKVSAYALVGTSTPPTPLVATGSGWGVTASGGAEIVDPIARTGYGPGPHGTTGSGFRLTGGVGSVDPDTGEGTITYPGTVHYAPYNFMTGSGGFDLANIRLTVADGRGTLTASLTGRDTIDTPEWGPVAVTLANFDVQSLDQTGASFSLSTAAPDFTGVAYGSSENAFPASFIDAVPSGFRAFFMTTGSSVQGNLNKAPQPISASYTATTPTTTTVSVSGSGEVVAGGAVQLTADLTPGVEGTVEFFDGATSLGTVSAVNIPAVSSPRPVPASNSATLRVPGITAGEHSYTAVFSPTASAEFGRSASPAVTVTGVAGPVAEQGNVSGAQLEWALSAYSLVGGGVPGDPLVGTAAGWAFSTSGGPEIVDPIDRTGGGQTGTGFRLLGGTGSVDPVTGEGSITYPGTVTYAPYNYGFSSGDFALSNFRLVIADGAGTLTATVTSKENQDAAQIGPFPVTLATFDVASLTADGATFSLVTEVPDFYDTVAAGTYAAGKTDAWPASFIAAIPASFRSFFYTSSASAQGNANKEPLPIRATFTAAAPTSVTLTLPGGSSVLAGGDVVLSAQVPNDIAGTVEFFDGVTSLGSATPVETSATTGQGTTVTTKATLAHTAVEAGSHAYRAVFTPADTASHGISTSASVLVAATAPQAPVAEGNVSDASLEWKLSAYALMGTAVPGNPPVASASGWALSASGGAEVVDPIARQGYGPPPHGTTGSGFRLTGGIGSVDPISGEGVIGYPGTVTYAPYNYMSGSGDFVLTDFRLALTGERGTLTASLTARDTAQTPSWGPVAVTLANFDVASLEKTGSTFALTTEQPDFSGVAYGTSTNAWPSTFVDAVPSAFRSFFFTTGASGQGNANKAPLPITAAFTAEALATTAGISVSQTSGLEAGDTVVVTATSGPAATAGEVRILLDGATIASGPVGTALVATTPALTAGSHALQAKVVPGDATAYLPSTSPTITLQVAAAPSQQVAGSLAWGISSGWTNYITGPIAHGAISVSNGATASGGIYTFAQTAGSTYDAQTGLGAVTYRGAVRWTGHNGELDLTLSNPVIRFDSATSATVLIGANQLAIATLNLANATKTVAADGSIRYADVPSTLTAAGAGFFRNYYAAGSALSPMTFVIGSASTAADAPARTVAAAPEESERQPAPTPPATEGIEVTGTDGEITEGGEITATASGFQANEQDILVVIYSEPTILSRTLTADANGVATWTGRLPAGLTGEHTLTFQGSVNRGVVLDIQALEIGTCTIESASFEWGFKESFRSYLDSSIAHGSWSTADGAVYETPLFRFAGGEGTYDAETASGRIQFPGSINFTAHEGVLDTTFSNPVFTFIDDETMSLSLDVDGDTREGEAVSSKGVEFVTLDLSAATVTTDGAVVTIADIPTVLTAAGHEAFGTYPAGEDFDPITITITTAEDCAAAIAEPEATDGAEPAAPVSDDSGADLAWLWWVIGGVLLAAIIVALIVARRRRNEA
ncbi:HtaA domain-containing protein [Salinibacterium sp. ZJ77]|uniref:HtaA domain-containing protein n=1 Tax=Salinibacterium sp. ZJ77 TaxID=2708337 RepID=UPI0014200A2C|nr:HtaA domain-containing protein [Salinibacterium sp. ZJ77]